jgi:hypothetical protein
MVLSCHRPAQEPLDQAATLPCLLQFDGLICKCIAASFTINMSALSDEDLGLVPRQKGRKEEIVKRVSGREWWYGGEGIWKDGLGNDPENSERT